MPKASGTIVKPKHYHYEDHDSGGDIYDPPVQGTWYTLFDETDVRALWCYVKQKNDESAAKTVQVKWTIDGQPYYDSISMAEDIDHWFYRSHFPHSGGVSGLDYSTDPVMCAYYTDKRGQSFKMEVRLNAVPGTNQQLWAYAVYETETET